ncbi:OLC1v1020294C1 [Oldenlandia corymbosa var. corymbosa]|uniref:OLC1v1020294C1 n=1 Tax=Oldenlandia corymbosa var. corymbosa TaxID=529605 RepID=A0AAV1EGC2_OLDCO|nr:OLC1v1020294C1 [Oldenlandia corymbosa var. corymbosa]
MARLGDDSEKTQPVQSESDTDFSDAETVDFDAELPTHELPGDELNDDDIELEYDGLQYFQDTVPVDDNAFPYEDAFDTQKLDLDGETQVMDVCDGTQEVNLYGDTQVVDDCDGEILLLGEDGEEIHETEVLGGTQELSDDDSKRNGGANPEVLLGSLSNEGHSSGSTIRGFTSIRVASLRQSGLAARQNGMLCRRDSTKAGNDANQKNDPEQNDPQVKEFGNAYKLGGSAVRKLFKDDVAPECRQGNDATETIDGTGGDSLFAFRQEAGLSYISSQEPGDLSQADALDFVDKFLKLNAIESSEEVTRTKTFGEKSKPVSVAKGTKSLAKKASANNVERESKIFKWDDDVEDEGGGEFFQKKKDLFFDSGARRRRTVAQCRKRPCLDSKHSLTSQPIGEKKIICCNGKLKDASFSDSKLLSKNSRATIEVLEPKEPSFKRNLLNELNEEMDTTGDRLVDVGTGEGLPNNQDVGIDTQMAADAMETLHFAEHIGNVRNISERNKVDEFQSLDRSSKKKRARPSNVNVVTRRSKRGKGTDESSRGSPLSSLNQSKHGSKQSGAELSNREPRGNCEKLSPVPQFVRQTKKDGIPVSCDQSGETHATISSRKKSLRANSLQEELGSFTPVSHRTRGSIKVSRSKVENSQSSSIVGSEVGGLVQPDTFSRGKRTQSKLSVANAEKNSSSKRSKIDSTSYSVDLVQCQKEQPSECGDGKIVEKTVDNGKSLDVNGSRINGSMVKGRRSRHSGAKRDVANTISADVGKVSLSEKASPTKRLKQSASANTTPTGSRTPRSNASPICMGDEYHKQSCRKNLLRSSLMKELDSIKTTDCHEFTGAMKHSRKRRDITNVRALFSRHLDPDVMTHQKKILAKLGASVASSMSDATHFITDAFVRTRNMLEAIAYGKPVVTQLWLESCGQANCFIDEKNHILRDAKKEREFGFSMPVSLARAQQHPLLQGRRVFMTPNTKPGKEILAGLVKAVHGLAVERLGRSALKDEKLPDDILILSCEEDYGICVPFLEKGAAVYSSELLLNGIVTQRLEYERLVVVFFIGSSNGRFIIEPLEI